MRLRIFPLLLLFFLLSPGLFSQGSSFAAIGLSVAQGEKDFFTLTLYFNGPLDGGALTGRQLLVNDRPLPPVTAFRFSRNRHLVRFNIKALDQPFTLRLRQVRAADGSLVDAVLWEGLEPGIFLKFSREAGQWQKSLL